MAPEILSVTVIPGSPATQKGDVYSFAIILEEIVVRGGPYESVRQFMSVKSILERVAAHGEFSFNSRNNKLQLFLLTDNPPFRPFVGERDCPPDLLELMEKCWNDIPDERPTFGSIRTIVGGIMK